MSRQVFIFHIISNWHLPLGEVFMYAHGCYTDEILKRMKVTGHCRDQFMLTLFLSGNTLLLVVKRTHLLMG